MPIYVYKCSACGNDHDALQKINDAPLTDCPACGQPALVKQITAAGFQLKGSGWYVTDFRNNGNKPASASATSESGSASDSGSSGSASSSTPAPTSTSS